MSEHIILCHLAMQEPTADSCTTGEHHKEFSTPGMIIDEPDIE